MTASARHARSRTPPGRALRCDCESPVVEIVVDATTEPAPIPPIDVLVRRVGAAENEWVRLEPDGDGNWIVPFACTLYGWRLA